MKRTAKHGAVTVYPDAKSMARDVLSALATSPAGHCWMAAVLERHGWVVCPPPEGETGE